MRLVWWPICLGLVLASPAEEAETLLKPRPTQKMLPTYQEMMRKHRQYPTVSPRYFYEHPRPGETSNEIPPVDESEVVEMKPLASDNSDESNASSEVHEESEEDFAPENLVPPTENPSPPPESFQDHLTATPEPSKNAVEQDNLQVEDVQPQVKIDINEVENETLQIAENITELEGDNNEIDRSKNEVEEDNNTHETDLQSNETLRNNSADSWDSINGTGPLFPTPSVLNGTGLLEPEAEDEDLPGLIDEEQRNNLCPSPAIPQPIWTPPPVRRIQVDERLYHMRQTLLESLECGNGNCTQLVIDSSGEPFLRHPPRLGLYTLSTLFEGYPVYSKRGSNQHLFYKKEFDRWEYAHRIERWVIGPMIGEAEGGMLFLTSELCPWKIDPRKTETFFYDRRVSNTWNPSGNGWKFDSSITISCYNQEQYPPFDCGCDTFNLSSSAKAHDLHPEKLGIYHRQDFKQNEGLLAPVFRHEEGGFWLYSHHHRGKLWLVGSSLKTWSLRLNLMDLKNDDGFFQSCPFLDPRSSHQWELLQRKLNDEEIWQADFTLALTCVERSS